MFALGTLEVIVDFMLKVGLSIFRTDTDSQRNPVYKAFHRIRCCGNETIRQ